jgi:PAS domain S-box-containing protein
MQAEAEGVGMTAPVVPHRMDNAYFQPFEAMPIPVHSMGPDGLLRAVNGAWEHYTGYSRTHAIGRSLAEFLDPASAERYRIAAAPEMIRAVAAGESRSIEYVMVKASGERADIVVTARPTRDAEGRFLYSLAVLNDITARNRAEAALRTAQKLEAIGALTSGVAHDFNNLLMIIQGSLQLLAKHLPAGDRNVARLLDAALQGAGRGAALTARLLAFARQQDLAPRPIALPPFLDTLRPMLRQLLGPEVQVTERVAAEVWTLSADPDQFELALLNLAANARDAMPDGGTVHLAARNATVRQPGSAFIEGAAQPALVAGDYVVLCFADTGVGMEEAVLARAADPFFTTKGLGKGTGLGLSMVHGFAAQSGGGVQLHSQPGTGTMVELWLPRTQASVTAAGPVPAAAAPSANAAQELRILLVDDDALVRDSTLAMLDALGCAHVQAVSSGGEALALLQADDRFDLLLTDYMMPGMSGAQLAARARALRPDIAVLLASGFAELDAVQGGRWPRLRKPYTLSDMASALAAVAERK